MSLERGPELSTLKTDRRFKTRFILRSAILLMPPLVAFVVMWRSRGQALAVWPAALFFVVWIVGWIVVEAAILRAYSCPACGRRIGHATTQSRSAGDPIRYSCRECGIEWDTGLRESGE